MADADWERGLSEQAVIIDLHGTKAKRGVELDGFQAFLEHFRRALRDFERASSAQEQIGRAGRPRTRSEVLTGFRLVRFKEGSGLAAFEPVEQYPGEAEMGEPAPSRNLRLLLESVESANVPPPVIDALNQARRAIGEDGSFGVRLRSQKNGGRVAIDADTMRSLEATVAPPSPPEPEEVTVSGVLHLIEVYEPVHVAIRATDGIEWTCKYDASLEPKVLRLVKSLVWATGTGRKTGPKAGTMHLRSIDPVAQHVQTTLFSVETIPPEDLSRQQHVLGPQGLDALEDRDWVDDEQGRAFLAFILGEDEA